MLLHRADRLPSGEGWAFEPKWDGFRCLAHLAEHTTLLSRRGMDLAPGAPELARLHRAVPVPVVLDSELVAVSGGRPSLDALRRRVLGGRREPDVRLVLVAFDLLVLGERSITALPYDRRRRILEALGMEGSGIQLCAAYPASEGPALFAATKDLGMEGVVAKRLDSPYRAGIRSSDWVKVKHWRAGAFRIAGWLPDQRGNLKALLLGRKQRGSLVYAGAVEYGFDRAALQPALEALAVPEPVLLRAPHGTRPVRPDLVVRVRYSCLSEDGRVRAASVVGIRR